jgi:response regulator RpfG family c-di-GMP phosphodiesterase
MSIIELMYADDDHSDVEMFATAVNSLIKDKVANINLCTFRTGEEIITTLKNKKKGSSIVFLDINIPVKNGFQVLKEMRATRKLEALPVVMYTTSKDKTSIDIRYELGAILYVFNPHTSSELFELLRTVILFDFQSSKPEWANFVLTA